MDSINEIKLSYSLTRGLDVFAHQQQRFAKATIYLPFSKYSNDFT